MDLGSFYYRLRFYQLDLITPGSLPCEARSRKQIRQIPNFLIKALGLPQMGQRLYDLALYFGARIALILRDFFANSSSSTINSLTSERHAKQLKKFFSFFVRLCGCNNGYIQPFNLINFIIIDLGKNNMLLNPEGVISPTIQRFP